MATLERTVERREYWNGAPRRLSWAAIFGGAFVAVAVMTVLGALGVAIGAMVIDPAGDSPSATAFGWGAVIWWIVSGMIAIFLGGLVAARLGGRSRGLEGPLHGIVTWAVVSLATMFFVTSAIGALIGGAFGVLRTTASVAQQGVQMVGQTDVDVSEKLKSFDLPQTSWKEVREEAGKLLKGTDKKQGELEAARKEAREAADTEGLQAAEQELDAAIEQLHRASRDGADEADKGAVVNVLVARTDMERGDAEKKVDEWADQFEKAWSETKSTLSEGKTQEGMTQKEMGEKASEVAQASTEGLSAAAWGMFIYLVLTLLAGGLGGLLGAPKRRDASHVTEERTSTPVTTPRTPPRSS